VCDKVVRSFVNLLGEVSGAKFFSADLVDEQKDGHSSSPNASFHNEFGMRGAAINVAGKQRDAKQAFCVKERKGGLHLRLYMTVHSHNEVGVCPQLVIRWKG
jgi:hypothetical protein